MLMLYHPNQSYANCLTGLNFCTDLSEEQLQFQESARKFAREEILPVAAHHDRTGEYPHQIVKKAWELGFLNAHIPQSCGRCCIKKYFNGSVL